MADFCILKPGRRMDAVLEFLGQATSQQQRTLEKIIQHAGGSDAVLGQARIMNDLIKRETAIEIQAPNTFSYGPQRRTYAYRSARRRPYSPPHSIYYESSTSDVSDAYAGRRTRMRPFHQTGEAVGLPSKEPQELRKLKEELVDSPEISIQKNSEVFERRFKILQRDIAVDMNKIVEREGDRVIDTVLAGPHEKILDPVCFLPGLSQNSNIDMTMFRTCTRSGRTW